MPKKTSKNNKNLKQEYFQLDLFGKEAEKKIQNILRKQEVKAWVRLGNSIEKHIVYIDGDIVAIKQQVENVLAGESKLLPPEIKLSPKTKHSHLIKPKRAKLLRIWELFPFILPSKTKREVYEPAYNDLLADYLKVSSIESTWANRWLALCFTFRTAYMVAQCLAGMMGAKIKEVLFRSAIEMFNKWTSG